MISEPTLNRALAKKPNAKLETIAIPRPTKVQINKKVVGKREKDVS